jgi:hypothetical protein
MLNIDNKKFITIGNQSGLSTEETIFYYYENNDVVTGCYKGGAIIEGQIVGRKLSKNRLELAFQCVTDDGELKSGQSTGTIGRNDEGKITLSFDWNWLNGDLSGGKSFYVEMK